MKASPPPVSESPVSTLERDKRRAALGVPSPITPKPTIAPKPLVTTISITPEKTKEMKSPVDKSQQQVVGLLTPATDVGLTTVIGAEEIQQRSTPAGRNLVADLRKAYSMKTEQPLVVKKTPKRTPSFTTRRTPSLKKMRQWDDMQNIEKDGVLERKQEVQTGGHKATIRSWKQYYTILCGQLLCFFKDEEQFMENMAASPPVYILGATCLIATDYTKVRICY